MAIVDVRVRGMDAKEGGRKCIQAFENKKAVENPVNKKCPKGIHIIGDQKGTVGPH